jgi:hypothetical protein
VALQVDTRTGSAPYIEPLRAAGLPVEPAVLDAGDVAILGRGLGGAPTRIGVEIKQWDDVLMCVRSGRFADQLRRMRDLYEVRWLLIEGRIQAHDGLLAIRRSDRWYYPPGRVSYQEATSWLLTMCGVGGALLWRTESQSESVDWLRSLYWWWVSKDMDEHHAHLDFYQPPVQGLGAWEEPSPVQLVARNLPGIGPTRLRAVDATFPSVEEMVNAPESEWCAVEGIGPKTAKAIRRFVQSRRAGSGS